MALKPEDGTLAGVGLAIGVVALYDHFMPNVADHKAAGNDIKALDKSRVNATAFAIGLVGIAALLLKNTTVFVIGGVTVIALDASHRYADAVSPSSQTVPTTSSANPTASS